MTRKELEYVRTMLERIKDKDQFVAKAIAFIDKDIAIYNARRGQLREQYETSFYEAR